MLVKTIYPSRQFYTYTVNCWSYKHVNKRKDGQEKVLPRRFYIDLDGANVNNELLANNLLGAKCEILFEQYKDESIDASEKPKVYLLVNGVKLEL